MNREYLKGNISIGRVTSNVEENYIGIRIEDELSGINLLEIKISYEAFGNAVTGLSSQDIEYTLGRFDLAGKKREVKTENIMFLPNKTDKDIRDCISCFEINGWKGRDEDAKNHHNRMGQDIYKVTFVRWVDVP